jgi:hypothetical protein
MAKKIAVLLGLVAVLAIAWVVNDNYSRRKALEGAREAVQLIRTQIDAAVAEINNGVSRDVVGKQEKDFAESIRRFEQGVKAKNDVLARQIIDQLNEAHGKLVEIKDAYQEIAKAKEESERNFVAVTQEDIRSLTTTGRHSDAAKREVEELKGLIKTIRVQADEFKSQCSDIQSELDSYQNILR